MSHASHYILCKMDARTHTPERWRHEGTTVSAVLAFGLCVAGVVSALVLLALLAG